MMTTGPDGLLPAMLGGDGWAPRPMTHVAELASASTWARCGCRSEVAPLVRVLLARPPRSIARVDDPNALLMQDVVDADRLADELSEVVDFFRQGGVDVLVVDPPADAPPNIIFMRDLVLITPIGAIVGRMASAQRAGEERIVAAALSREGIPIARTITGAATFEGADALWLDSSTLVVGVGFRTDMCAAAAIADVVAEIGADVVTVPLGPGVQHLLGSLLLLDEDLAAVRSDAATPELRRLLADRGYGCLELAPDDDVLARRGMNGVVLGPRRVVIPHGAPSVRTAFERHGVTVEELDVGESIKAGGGLGCLVGIVERAGAHGDRPLDTDGII